MINCFISVPTFGFELPEYVTVENSTIEICVVLFPEPSLATTRNITIQLMDGTAEGTYVCVYVCMCVHILHRLGLGRAT